MPAAHQKQT